MTVARVIGLGQRAAGDDGVGPAIIDQLRVLELRDVELVEVAEPCALIPLVTTTVPVVIIDAIVMDRGTPGDVVELDVDAVPQLVRSVSTHGLGLAGALALARALAEPGSIPPSIRIVGVVIGAAVVPAIGLSAVVEAAVPRAVDSVIGALGAPAVTHACETVCLVPGAPRRLRATRAVRPRRSSSGRHRPRRH